MKHRLGGASSGPSDPRSARRRVSHPQPIKASDADYKRILVLGRGAYAKVVLVEERRTGIRYAMKILSKNHVVAQRQAEHTMTERHILSHTSYHPFIVNLKTAYRTPTTLNLVMDYCPGGELFFHLSREGQFDQKRAKFICAELTLALGHLHAAGIVYRDLKPENILIDADGHMRLADFGLCTCCGLCVPRANPGARCTQPRREF
jgi:serum/glucocorticoid-regulated kinase 2